MIQNCINELLSNNQVNLKKPRLMELVNRLLAKSKINRVNYITDLSDEKDSNTLGLYFSCFFNHGFNIYYYICM
jgi:hypothetical protein